jgi:two-component system chemotaxis response regulator CheB
VSNTLKILIVDDTVTYRSVLSHVVNSLSEAALIGTASNGKLALDELSKTSADIVLLDVEMPVMGGMETLSAILEKHPDMGVVLISSTSQNSADATIQALQAGALDFIEKPDLGSVSANMEVLRERLLNVIRLFRQRKGISSRIYKPVVSSSIIHNKPKLMPDNRPKKLTYFEVIAIGISTGGPNALAELIPKLPDDLDVPILVVQHMPPVFTASLAKSLDRKSALRVKEAEEAEIIQPNTVYIAPGGYHMTVQRKNATVHVSLNLNPPENSCRPSVDVLLRSMGQVYGSSILTVIMTGMGADGVQGVKELKEKAGCLCLTQSPESCTIYGMPKMVAEAGLSDESVDLAQLPEKLVSLVRYGQGKGSLPWC